MQDLREVLLQHREEYLRCLTEVVAIDTQDIGHGILGGREKEGQEYMKKFFAEIGADKIEEEPMTEGAIQKCLEEHQEGNLGHNYEDRYNVYATFQGEGSKSLIFNGHIDTMPPGDLSKWTSHPHKPEIRDGKLYGLGTADMKAGLIASALGVKLLKDAGMKLPCNVTVTSVCDEEGGGNGSMAAIMGGKKADAVVVCEPTGYELILAHMGFVFFDVKIVGKANHSGAKWLGVSAIEKAMKIIRELDEVEHGWLLKYKHPLLPAPNLNVGEIHGGTAGSTVAGECEFKTCVHYLPEIMSYDQVVAEFTDAVERVSMSDPWLREHKPEVTVYQAGGAFEMEEQSPFVDAFKEAYKNIIGTDVKVVGSPAGCDSRLWKNIAGCPTIQYGPGNLVQCHAVNEYVDVQAYLDSILIYAQLILAWGRKN